MKLVLQISAAILLASTALHGVSIALHEPAVIPAPALARSASSAPDPIPEVIHDDAPIAHVLPHGQGCNTINNPRCSITRTESP